MPLACWVVVVVGFRSLCLLHGWNIDYSTQVKALPIALPIFVSGLTHHQPSIPVRLPVRECNSLTEKGSPLLLCMKYGESGQAFESDVSPTCASPAILVLQTERD